MLKGLVFVSFTVIAATGALADPTQDCANLSGDAAIRACDQAIRQNPRGAESYTNRGIEYAKKGDLDHALADFNEAIELNPKYAEAYNNRGIAYRGKGDLNRALADYNKAIELNPKYAEAYNSRGIAYLGKNDLDRAIADFTESIRQKTPQLHLPYNNRGIAYRGKGDLDRALADFNEAIELDSKFAEACNNRGNAYSDQGDIDRALADYSKAVQLQPNNVTFIKNVGYARFYRGDFKDAAADLLRALELKDDIYPMLFRFLARSRSGETAVSELEANAARLKTKEWPYAVIDLYLGRRQPDATLAAAVKPDDRCEAYFYIGQWYVLKDNKAEAEAALKTALDTCPKTFIEYAAAVAEWKRLRP
jgi:tetratricopeptide (TPR) repeat protein